jgi:ActR/RegA family two-component response regulator
VPANILVVEDNAVLAMDIESEAAKFGMRVTVTKDPAAAIAFARRNPVAVAFVDVNLQGAYEGLEVVRAMSAETDAKLVIITAYSGADLAGHMIGIERVPVVFKPVQSGDVTKLLLSFLERADTDALRQ